jgi:hypothetical protein
MTSPDRILRVADYQILAFCEGAAPPGAVSFQEDGPYSLETTPPGGAEGRMAQE